MSSYVKSLAILLTIVPFSPAARAQAPISLMAPNDAWSFNNGS